MALRRPILVALLTAATALAGCSQGDGADAPGATKNPAAKGTTTASPSATGTASTPATNQFGERFNLIGMAHTSPATPGGLPIEVDTSPCDDTSTGGPFSYASAPCSANAPINNVSTNLVSFNTRLKGSRSPASTRLHPVQFEVVSNDSGSGALRGTIDLTVCQPRFGVTPPGKKDTTRDRISFTFTATFKQPTKEETTWAGQFQIADATGVYQGIRGGGEIAGYFMCLGPERCAQQGGFRDAQVAMIGSYDPPEGALQ